MSRLMISVSGIRGEIGRTLTPETSARFGAAFATMIGSGKTVLIARDSRPSGPMVRHGVMSGLLACGVKAIDLGVVSTPGAALMTRRLGADGAAVITASHNPIEWNGVKFLRPSGLALSVEGAAELKRIWESGQFAYVAAADCGTESSNFDTHTTHIKDVLSMIDVNGVAAKRFKVVLDSVNGAGCVGSGMLLSRLGCELVHINERPTGLFAHTPEPTAANLTDLCKQVVRHRAAVGFAQDPDADRLALVDENGVYIGEEYTLAICAAYILAKRKGTAAANLSTSRMIDAIAERNGTTVFRTPVGEANVAGCMIENDCIFGGEGNGGVIDPRVVPVRDSMVGMALVLAAMTETGKTLSELVADIPRYEMIKTKFPCPADAAPQVAAAAKAHFADRPGAKFNDSDGLRIDLADGWVHVRASNTEPIMRIIAEADTRDLAEALVAEVRAIADPLVS